MDPPATYLTPLSTSEVSIFRAGGHAGLRARGHRRGHPRQPRLRTAAGRLARGHPLPGSRLRVGPGGIRAEAGCSAAIAPSTSSWALGYREYDDYTAPDGTVVPGGPEVDHRQRHARLAARPRTSGCGTP